jgi:hypothetical protein
MADSKKFTLITGCFIPSKSPFIEKSSRMGGTRCPEVNLRAVWILNEKIHPAANEGYKHMILKNVFDILAPIPILSRNERNDNSERGWKS